MKQISASLRGAILFTLLFAMLMATALPSPAQIPEGAQRLRQSHDKLQAQLDNSPFGRPLQIESVEAPSGVRGDVYARLDQPFDGLRNALARPESWCEIFILHINTKYCRPVKQNGGAQLLLKIGSKDYQELSSAHTVKFDFKVLASSADYFEARMEAPEGPLGTTNYRVVLSAIPLASGKSFISLRYSYSYNRLGGFAMDAYLNTKGRDKVGFSRIGPDQGGKPQFVKGYRGVVERNAMRYYLAIDAFLASLSQPENFRRERALSRWFEGTEQYATQLHELGRGEYMANKKRELERIRDTPPEAVE